ncbi:tetratricopeptide repeat protein [Siccirubricoccus deserti]
MDMHASPPAPSDAINPAELLARADSLRDRRDWAEAAQAYAGYLRLRGDDWPIWVQYGHCMKEAGDPRAALLLYREAERLQPEDADLHLQIGHALKLLGRQEEALEEYARALTLDPGNAAARQELLMVGPGDTRAPSPASAEPGAPVIVAPPPPAPPAAVIPLAKAAGAAPTRLAVVFDASDLLDYFRHNRAPTGIQRVQLSLIREALTGAADCAAAAAAFDPMRGVWVALPGNSSSALPRCRAAAPISAIRPGPAPWPRCRRCCGRPRRWPSPRAAIW